MNETSTAAKALLRKRFSFEIKVLRAPPRPGTRLALEDPSQENPA
ncbi:hypothetical protein [Piscinibacter gummiphilus]|nr:hypothetical protein [Piscinibacter gummiphilus]